MKLGPLNSAIRANEGSIKFRAAVPGGKSIVVGLIKGELIAGLAETFTEGRGQETGLWIREDGTLMKEQDRPVDSE